MSQSAVDTIQSVTILAIGVAVIALACAVVMLAHVIRVIGRQR